MRCRIEPNKTTHCKLLPKFGPIMTSSLVSIARTVVAAPSRRKSWARKQKIQLVECFDALIITAILDGNTHANRTAAKYDCYLFTFMMSANFGFSKPLHTVTAPARGSS